MGERIRVREIIILADRLDDLGHVVSQVHKALRSDEPRLPDIVAGMIQTAERYLFYDSDCPRTGEVEKS